MQAPDSLPDMMPPPRPKVDRTVLAGVLMSLGVHSALLGLLLLGFRHQDSIVADPRNQPTVEVDLLPAPVAARAATAGDPLSAPAPEPQRAAVMASTPLPRNPVAPVPGSPLASVAAAAAPVAPAPAAIAGTPVPVTTTPAAAALDGDAYRRVLLDHIAGFLRQASEHATGTVMIRFLLTRDGRVLSASVARSSGVTDLDDEAIGAIWRAGPMPAIPPTLPDRLSVTLPVSFSDRRQAAG